jgi:ABC-type transport system substrate-binding protein
MSRNFTGASKTILILILAGLIIPAGLSSVQVHASSCYTGLSPNLHFTLLVPTSNPARRAWAAIVQSSLQCLGISADRVELPFSPNIYDRALVPPASNIGKTFDQGGFDILFVGYNLGIDPDPWSLYSSTQFAPSGSNYYLWNNTQNDALTNLIKTTLNQTTRNGYVQQWQVLGRNELPSIPILYTRGVVAFDSKFPNAQSVFNVYHYPAWPTVEHLSSNPVNGTFIFAETGQAPGQGVVPELSTSYYDLALSGEIFSSLALRNDTYFKTMIPDLASGTPTAPGWNSSADGKTWTVNIRPGVTWQDGQPFTANDVKFTFDLYQNDTFGSPTESFVKGIVGGINNVTITGPSQVTFHLPAPYAYFVQNILSTGILPKHILSAFSKDYSKIANSLFNRPDIGSNAVSASLPIGTGPYVYQRYDSASTTNYLTRNDNYFNFSDWGKAALQSKGQFQVKNYDVRTIIGGDQAITALSSSEVDFLDSQYHLETQPSFLSSWGSSLISTYDDFGVQEMGVNMEHPILGTGTATPYAQAYPGNATAAANAARWIRQAISYATPRDSIISQLLNGYGVPAITTPIVGNYRTGVGLTQGFNTALSPYPYNLTMATSLLQQAGYTPTSGGGLAQYELIIIIVVVVAVVAVAAVYIMRVRRKPVTGSMPGPSTTPPPPPPTSP